MKTTIAILILLAGCLEPGATVCSDGRTCPGGSTCDVEAVKCYQEWGTCLPGNEKQVRVSALKPGAMWIRRCDVNLGNGLACAVYSRYLGEKYITEVYEAHCYDGANRETTISLSGGKAKKKKSSVR